MKRVDDGAAAGHELFGRQWESARSVDESGRPSDGKPMMPGDRFRTVSGRATTPYPSQKKDRWHTNWLIENAVAEAEARGDDFNRSAFANEKPMKDGFLPPAVAEGMVLYLFVWQPPVVDRMTRPLVGR